MADIFTTVNNLYNQAATTVNQALNGSVSSIGNTISSKDSQAGIGSSGYQFNYDVFPEDLSSNYYNHYMTITAYTFDNPNDFNSPTSGPGSLSQFLGQGGGGGQRAQYTCGIFIPGGAGTAGIEYRDSHTYTDVKMSNLMGGAIGALTGGAVDGNVMNKAAALGGHPINPGVEILYQTPNLRTFQFVFLMAPTTENESNAMKNIIKKLRMFAAPELFGGNYSNSALTYFNTPAEFVIKFFHKGQENKNIPRIRRCVLTDINANFTPSGEWSTFGNGHPVSCMLSLQFQEMEYIHRGFVDQGF